MERIDYTYRRRKQRQQQFENLMQLAMTGLAVGGMAALGAVTILGMLGAL